MTDNAFLYSLWYFSFSILGNFNFFFFSAHLLDIAVAVPALKTILQSVTHNGKQVHEKMLQFGWVMHVFVLTYMFVFHFQLMLTVMLLTIIVYIYTVIAFNFFRKFYVTEDDPKCHDMLTVFFL